MTPERSTRSSTGGLATSSSSSSRGSVYVVDGVPGGLNRPEEACDSVGLPGPTLKEGSKIPPGGCSVDEIEGGWKRKLTVLHRIRQWLLGVGRDALNHDAGRHESIPVFRRLSEPCHDLCDPRS